MAKQIKPLDQQIEEYKNDYRFTKKLIGNKWINNKWSSYEYTAWNWDDNWDGQLIRDVQALEQAGFTIVSFSRKRKVTIRLSDNLIDDMYESGSVYGTTERSFIVDKISNVVGNDWYSISFKPTLSIYWKGRSSKWNR